MTIKEAIVEYLGRMGCGEDYQQISGVELCDEVRDLTSKTPMDGSILRRLRELVFEKKIYYSIDDSAKSLYRVRLLEVEKPVAEPVKIKVKTILEQGAWLGYCKITGTSPRAVVKGVIGKEDEVELTLAQLNRLGLFPAERKE